MKAVAPHIEKLYEAEIERWRAAWDEFDAALRSHLRQNEVQALMTISTASRPKK